MRVTFLGPPGAGKGTQARELAREWSVPHIATGDILREVVAARTPLGLEAKRYMDRGALVPDEVIIDLIGERLRQPTARAGFILDGFPRTIAQAEALERLLKEMNQTLDRVIFFEVSEPEIVRRLSARRVCRNCGATYHLTSAPPREPDRCDRCGGPLSQRADDREATVRNRLRVYLSQTAPLLDYYEGRSLLSRVMGEGSVDAIRAAIRRALRNVTR